jgi:ribose 5-phosphate isomerase A
MTLKQPGEVEALDILIDGADECDGQGRMIKGGGGALLREKLLATLARRRLYVMDASKKVEVLGRFPLPVEVVPFACEVVKKQLEKRGFKPVLRQKEGGVYETDNGNYILDCHGLKIDNPFELQDFLKSLVGVVEQGLFLNAATEIYVAGPGGVEKTSFDVPPLV